MAASCSGATTAHAFDLCPVHAGDSVLVQGVGPVGAFAVAFARAGGAQEIIVVGGTRSRLELCQRLGATHLIDRNATTFEERVRMVKEITNGRGVDLAVEGAGTIDAFAEGPSYVRIGGSYAVAGIAEPRDLVPFDVFRDVARKNLHMQGVWVSGHQPPATVAQPGQAGPGGLRRPGDPPLLPGRGHPGHGDRGQPQGHEGRDHPVGGSHPMPTRWVSLAIPCARTCPQ